MRKTKTNRHRSGFPKLLPLALAIGVTCAASSLSMSAALAATIPFNEALNFSYNPDATGMGNQPPCCDYVNIIHSGPPTPAVVSYSKSGLWGTATGFASADLATGQLKSEAAASISALGGATPAEQSNAIFGDGFRATAPGNQPFNWTSASHSRFTLDLSGSLNASHALDASFNPDAFVILSILNKDTLDPLAPLINGPSAQQYFFWNIGNPSTTIYYTDRNGNSQILTPTAQYSSIPSRITADFNPGGDFDWVLLLGGTGQIFNQGDYFDLDFLHTLTLSYAGPDGSVTTSVSGQFANFNPTLPPSVPEPATLALLGLGLAGLGYSRRKR